MEPFSELSHRPTVVHVRAHDFSDRSAPFIRQTVLGLRPYVNNVVLARGTDCVNPPDVHIEEMQVHKLRNPFTCLVMAHYLRDKYPSISLVMGHMGNGTRVARPLAEMLGVPLLGTFGGSDVNIEWMQPKYRPAYEDLLKVPSAHFLTVAGYLRDKLLAYGVPAERLFTWHRGVNLADFEVTARPDRPLVRVVVSARFYEVKGHEYVIRALAMLNRDRRRAELTFLGDGPLEDSLRALAGELGVADDVQFVGRVSHDQVYAYLQSADIYVHPSVTCSEGRIEGVPNAIMEAHATGLPVVATRHGGIPEVVIDGESGFLVAERDPEQLARRIGELCDSRELRARMGARGREHVEREFNLHVQSRRLAARILHTIEAGSLFDLRGWSKHKRSSDSVADLSRQAPPPKLTLDVEALMPRLLNPTFVARRKVVGPVIRLYKQAVWAAIVKPYMRFIGRELTSFIARELSSQFTHLMGTINVPSATHAHAAPRFDTSTQLLMSSAACPDCPHCPTNAPWPDQPCPLDRACFETLQQEFSAQASPADAAPAAGVTLSSSPSPSDPDAGATLSLSDADLPSDGRLAHDDDAYRVVTLSGTLQTVTDVPALFAELRRILGADGELRLEVWPLARGRDGARLLGPITVPFSQHFFSREVIESVVGPAPRRPREFDADDVRRWAAEAGFVVREAHTPHPDEDPCEMHVQARFAPLFRKLGLSRTQLARAVVATLVPNVAAAATRAEPARHEVHPSPE